jgi:hypothetical protein
MRETDPLSNAASSYRMTGRVLGVDGKQGNVP